MKKISCFFILILVTGVTSIKSQDTIKNVVVKTIDIIAPGEVTIIEDEPVFVIVEQSARFQGGDLSRFKGWVQKSIVYPEIARENGLQGKVIIQFSVSSTGNVVEGKILRGVDPSLDNEALRVVMSSPDWEPAKQGGVPVKQQFVIPVIFDPGKMAK